MSVTVAYRLQMQAWGCKMCRFAAAVSISNIWLISEEGVQKQQREAKLNAQEVCILQLKTAAALPIFVF